MAARAANTSASRPEAVQTSTHLGQTGSEFVLSFDKKKVGPKEKKPFHVCGRYDITPGGIGNCVAAARLGIILPVKDTA